MKRQNLRSGLLLVSLLLLPVTIYFFSPLAAVKGAMAGVVSASLLFYGFLFLGSIFAGRAFCGWIMPCGALQEFCAQANPRPARGGWRNRIKYLTSASLAGALVFLLYRAGGIKGLDPLRDTENGVWLTGPQRFMIYFGVTGTMVTAALIFGRRAFCHYLCVMAPIMIAGRTLRNMLRLPSLQLERTTEGCVACGRCNQACPMSIDVKQAVRTGNLESAECILCGRCADSCPQKVLKLAFGVPRHPQKAPNPGA